MVLRRAFFGVACWLAAAALAAGCYSPSITDGQFSCSEADPRCPAGFVCDPCRLLCLHPERVCSGPVDLAPDRAAAPDSATIDLAPPVDAAADSAAGDGGVADAAADLAPDGLSTNDLAPGG